MATLVSNTVTFNKHDYVVSLRKRIAQPTTWRDIMNVKITDNRTIVNSSMTTEPSVQSGTREDQYTYQGHTLTADTLTISTYEVLPQFIDEADRHQQSYLDTMKVASFQGRKVEERLESLTLGQHTNWTDFGASDLTNSGADDTTKITVSVTNIDDIIRAVKRKQNENNLVDFAVENGRFFVWRPEDMELLEAFVQANGFNEADIALKNGIPVEKAFRYMGCSHYLSTNHTANHVFAGVKKMGELGILRSTFGAVKMIEDPDRTSGVGIITRVDYGFNWPSYYSEGFMDVNVN